MATIGQHYAELAVDPSALQVDSLAETRTSFRQALDSYHHYNEQAETRLQITASLIGQIADRADDAATSARWRAWLLLSLALLGFAAWITFAVLVRRSVIRPVLALTGAAQEVADVAGRELARVADDDAEESGPPRLRELPVTADDEIGELADAFNNVQTTAAALLERQVLSRRNVAEMFGNVGRRVSNLTTRQLALIDAVERGETDPELLERLYSIDHIAVRLRRNADSLMLLAGIRETVLDAGPAALTNVVRAALGQIEGFQRVRLHAGTEAMVEPDIIGDLTLMVAELVENAVSFSPEGSPVEVAVDSDDDGATITVADHGLGMSAERLAEENARLVRRERLDLVPTKVLGLFVVGALARRWDITVTLSRTPGGGVTAEVSIPSALLLTLSAVGVPAAAASSPAAAGAPSAAGTPTGPSASTSTPSWAVDDDRRPSPLPRRVPRRDTAPAEDTEPSSTDEAEDGAQVTRDAVSARQDREPATQNGAHATRDAAPTSAARGRTADGGTDDGGKADGGADDRTTEPADHGDTPERPAPGGPAQSSAHARAAEPDARNGHRGARAEEPADHAGRARPTAPAGTGDVAGHAPDGTAPTADSPPPDHTRGTDAVRPAGAADPAAGQAAAGGARPLRRRVRGATLRTTVDAAQQTARQAVRPADADAVRSALEEFEAAVERAHRDTGGGTGEHPRPVVPHAADHNDPENDDHRNPMRHQNHLPEGAEQ
jgi:signal transduction histidine kinase